MERINAVHMAYHMKEHHLLSRSQQGFRKGRSISNLLLYLAHTWQDALDSGRPFLVIVLDIVGSFNQGMAERLLAKTE